ncbi:MAG: hypothetical protein JSS20_22240, partial [Proteobacteria bacterium]|nr:hypothetical protein [Pseudomonadota bacterium]
PERATLGGIGSDVGEALEVACERGLPMHGERVPGRLGMRPNASERYQTGQHHTSHD